MTNNESRKHYIGSISKCGHMYYIYRRSHNEASDVWIRDDDNGERVRGRMNGEPDMKQVFDYFYASDKEFKEYVDSDGRCLYDVRVSTKYTEQGEVTTIMVPYASRNGICLPKSCGDCPVGYQLNGKGDCGMNKVLTENDFVKRPMTCRLRQLNLAEVLKMI